MKLLEDFKLAILPSGKINSQWRKKHEKEGLAILAAVPDAESLTEAIYRLKTNSSRPTCSCGKDVKFSLKNGEYSRFCSPKCGQLDASVRKKIEDTNIERHGVKHAGGFGTKQNENAILKKYGSRAERDTQIQVKIKQTNRQKYGAENVFQVSHVKQKIAKTTLDRYGLNHVMQSPVVKQKFRNEHGEWKPAIANVDKRKSATLKTITDKVKSRLKENGFELLSEPLAFSYNNVHLVKHECGHEFNTPLYSGSIPRCLVCEPLLCGTSLIQQKVENLISSLGIEFTKDRTILEGKEIDVYVESHKVGFEINGLYSHSELAYGGKKDADAIHLYKTELAKTKNIRLVHLFEDDIRHRWDNVESMILNIFKRNVQRIFARKCKVAVVEKKEAKAFCDKNHLKKSARFSIAIGLYYNDELVSVGTFAKPRYDKSHDYELIRFCSLLKTSVVGGLSKIINHFQSLAKPSSIISYADRSYSEGNVYQQTGFILKKVTKPNYWYFKSSECVRHHPTQLRKYKLKRMYNDLNMTKTEWQLLQERGWNRIWDCGQLVFVKYFNLEM